MWVRVRMGGTPNKNVKQRYPRQKYRPMSPTIFEVEAHDVIKSNAEAGFSFGGGHIEGVCGCVCVCVRVCVRVCFECALFRLVGREPKVDPPFGVPGSLYFAHTYVAVSNN